MALTLLPANTPRSFYRGAGRVHRFRGIPQPDDLYYPEDWVGSTTSRFGQAPLGLTVLPDGGLLADAIAARPEWWLGAEHVAAHGADPTILVKLLDAGERLPLHVHPDRRFANDHLASPYGKTEAWVVVEADPDAVVHLGFARDVAAGELADWVAHQRTDDMLAATNQVPVRAGDAILCPAGVPHAIGAGVFIVEVQEPTDFSVLLEWKGFADGPEGGHLGLGYDLALSCVDRQAWPPARLDDLSGPGGSRVLPPRADAFFAVERLRPAGGSNALEPAFGVMVVTAGAGTLEAEHEPALAVRAGHTVLIPHGAGRCTLRGQVEAVRCKPAPLPR
jgi:mannose-6-phosphate isomerase